MDPIPNKIQTKERAENRLQRELRGARLALIVTLAGFEPIGQCHKGLSEPDCEPVERDGPTSCGSAGPLSRRLITQRRATEPENMPEELTARVEAGGRGHESAGGQRG